MIYLLIFLLLFALVYHYDYQGHARGRIGCYVAVLFILIIVAGLRYRIGIDTVAYEYDYLNYPDLTGLASFDYDSTRYSIGYIFFNAIARTISDDFFVLQFMHTILINTIFFYIFYKSSRHIFSCLLFYYLFQYTNYNFEIIRESCAVAMFVLGYTYLCKRQWLKYYLCATGAVLFHTSGLVTFVVPLLFIPGINSLFRVNKKTLIIVGGLYLVGAIVATKFFDIIRLLEVSSLDSYANTYETTHYAEGGSLNIIGIISFVLMTLCYPLGLLWLKKRHKLADRIKYFSTLETLVVMSVYISTLKLHLPILYRFNSYFGFFLILLFADVIFNELRILGKRIKFSFGIWIILFLPYCTLSLSQYNQATEVPNVKKYVRYYPYETIISKHKDPQREKLY